MSRVRLRPSNYATMRLSTVEEEPSVEPSKEAHPAKLGKLAKGPGFLVKRLVETCSSSRNVVIQVELMNVEYFSIGQDAEDYEETDLLELWGYSAVLLPVISYGIYAGDPEGTPLKDL